MKRLTALLLCVCTLLLVGCGKRGKLTDEGYLNPKTGIEYVEVTAMKLYPVNQGEEFITVTKNDEKIVFHEVLFESTDKFLCYGIEGNYFLVRATTVTEPTLSEFSPIAAAICKSDNKIAFDHLYADPEYLPEDRRDEVTLGETALCKQIANAIDNGEAVELNAQFEDFKTFYYLHLYSADYPGLFYLISFFEYNGRHYLRDSSMGKTVYCPNDVILRLTTG